LFAGTFQVFRASVRIIPGGILEFSGAVALISREIHVFDGRSALFCGMIRVFVLLNDTLSGPDLPFVVADRPFCWTDAAFADAEFLFGAADPEFRAPMSVFCHHAADLHPKQSAAHAVQSTCTRRALLAHALSSGVADLYSGSTTSAGEGA
jgi:hypothetical protein